MKGGLLLCVNKTKFEVLKFESESSNILTSLTDKKSSKLIKLSFAYFSPNISDNATFEKYVKNLSVTKPDIVIGDFNARTSCLNTPSKYIRKSKDSKGVNKRGKFIINNMQHFICNGLVSGDEKGEFTFNSKRGSSVVDLCLVSTDMIKENLNLKVIENEHSHHSQIVLYNNSHVESLNKTSTPRIRWNDKNRSKFL